MAFVRYQSPDDSSFLVFDVEVPRRSRHFPAPSSPRSEA